MKNTDEKKEKTSNKKAYLMFIFIIFFIIVIDQLTKIFALNTNNTNIVPDILTINVSQNTNGIYGVNSNSVLLYVLTNLIVITILIKFITSQNEFIDTKIKVFLSAIVAGGISNTIDRIFRGYVLEFISFKSLPIINIADICIFIGWLCFIVTFLFFVGNKEQ